MLKVLTKGCEPTRGSKYSACVDLYASEDVVIGAGETRLVGLGVSIDIDHIEKIYYKDRKHHNRMFDFGHFVRSHYLQLMLRSSLGKKGLILPNGVGIIDLDYRDEIKMIIHNPIRLVDYDISDNMMFQYSAVDDRIYDQSNAKYANDYTINSGDKIAQITMIEHKSYLFGIDTDKERDGGFGSTGG